MRGLVEEKGAPWFVLSALYGLVAPSTTIEPYNKSLNALGTSERQAWATRVLRDLLPHARKHRRVIMFAGVRYREFLIGPLQGAGITVEVPLADLRQGEQLSWLSKVR